MLEGVRIILLSESSVKAFAVPRLKLADVKDRRELSQPSLYVLLSADGTDAYIGENPGGSKIAKAPKLGTKMLNKDDLSRLLK